MPEITPADRDRFQEWHDFDATLAPISGDDKQRLLEAFAAHREAAVAEERERIVANLNAHVEVLLKKNAAYAAVGLQDYIDEIKQVATLRANAQAAEDAAVRAERERIVKRLRDKASIKRVVAKHEGGFDDIELSDEARALKMAESYALTQAANEIALSATTPPEPRALTAEIVREMLPANKSPVIQPGFPHAFYESPLGAIGWWYDGDEIRFQIGDRIVSLATIGTDRKLAALVAALGISEGVKHG